MNVVNGVVSDHISVNDRGLQFAHGLFETMLIKNQQAQDLDLHLQRMKLGCERLQIEFPSNWQDEILQFCTQDGVLKLILTSGDSKQGLKKPDNIKPNRIIKINKLPHDIEYKQKYGIKVKICQTRLSCNPQTFGLKCLNWLEPTLANMELGEQYLEGLMLNMKGEIIEGTTSNFFAFKNDTLFTPDLKECGLKGITRAKVLAIATEMGLNVSISTIKDYHDFTSCFITNSVIGLVPIKEINNTNYVINKKQREIQAILLNF